MPEAVCRVGSLPRGCSRTANSWGPACVSTRAPSRSVSAPNLKFGPGGFPSSRSFLAVSRAPSRASFPSRTLDSTPGVLTPTPHSTRTLLPTRPGKHPLLLSRARLSPSSSGSGSASARVRVRVLKVIKALDAPHSPRGLSQNRQLLQGSQSPPEAPHPWGPETTAPRTPAVAVAAHQQPGPEVEEGTEAPKDTIQRGGEELSIAGSAEGVSGGEPQAKRNKSGMAVLGVAEGAVSVAGTEGALSLQAQKAAQAWATATQQQQQVVAEHAQSRQQASSQDQKQQLSSASPPFIQGPLAALRGYLLSTSGRAVFAVGSFGARQGQPSSSPAARPGGQDLPPLPTPRPGGAAGAGTLGTPSSKLVATRALPPRGPGAWWSESSEDVGPTVSDTLGATLSEVSGRGGAPGEGEGDGEGNAAAVGRADGIPQVQAQAQQEGGGSLGQELEGADPLAFAASTGAVAGAGAGLSVSAARGTAQGPGGQPGGRAGASSAPAEGSGFVNEGLLRWQERRAAWRTGRSAGSSAAGPSSTAGTSSRPAGTGAGAGNEEQHSSHGQHHRQRRRPADQYPKIRPGTTYEDILSSSKPFPVPVPLPEMVEFLVEIWKEEGLYD